MTAYVNDTSVPPPLTKRQARLAVRKHWAEYILNADCPPDGCADVWEEENRRIVRFLNAKATGATR